jgi:hypothetical protein
MSEVMKMTNMRILVFQDQIENLCRMGRKCRVIGAMGSLVLVEELPEETEEDAGVVALEEPERW